MTHANRLNQWITAEQQAKLAAAVQSLPLAEQKRRGEALKALFEELLARDARDQVTGPVTVQQIQQWESLTQQLAGGDQALTERIRQAYTQRGTLESGDQGVQEWLQALGKAATEVEKARQARSL